MIAGNPALRQLERAARCRPEYTGLTATLFRTLPTQMEMAAAFGDRWRQHGVLWHVVQFYMTGLALQRILATRDIEYRPYLYSEGLFDRAWPQYRQAVETNWAPYVLGEITRAQAIERTVEAVR